jgi:hypothetical protein
MAAMASGRMKQEMRLVKPKKKPNSAPPLTPNRYPPTITGMCTVVIAAMGSVM